jgi:autotransporter passenger strand-loop-strand repeat protein
VSAGGTLIVPAGGKATDANVSRGGALVVSSGGVVDPTTIFSGGTETIRAGGTDDGARISGGGKLFIQSGGTAIDITIFSGGSAVNSAHGELGVVVSATDSGVLVNSGTINVRNGATLTLGAATLNDAGSINLLGSNSRTTLFITHDVTLSGGGTLSMTGGANLITDSGGGFTLTNVNDKIVGAGGLGGDFALFVVNKAGGVINGNGTGGELDIFATITNAGLIEGTTSRGVAMVEARPLRTPARSRR